jgi:hypothetical protein
MQRIAEGYPSGSAQIARWNNARAVRRTLEEREVLALHSMLALHPYRQAHCQARYRADTACKLSMP